MTYAKCLYHRMGSIQRSKGSQKNANKNIFIAVDDSEASDRAVTYVAQMVDGRREFHILLFHVPASMLPQLLEFGGAEVSQGRRGFQGSWEMPK
jgi:hypothetical protein